MSKINSENAEKIEKLKNGFNESLNQAEHEANILRKTVDDIQLRVRKTEVIFCKKSKKLVNISIF